MADIGSGRSEGRGPGATLRALAPAPAWATLAFLGYLLAVWGHEGTPSVAWMKTVDLASFRTAGDVWTWLLDLRTGIPPVLSTIELLWWVRFRDLGLFERVAYPASIALGFTFALLLLPRRPAVLVPAFVLGLALARQGAAIHAGNPALYDVVFGALLTGYFVLTRGWRETGRRRWLVAAGLALALMELTRPFMLFLLPAFVLVEAHGILRSAARPGRALAAFLLPVAILSGGWHLHLYRAHDGQVTWTNFSGFNLQRAWADFAPEIRDAPLIPMRPEAAQPWGDLNTPEVSRHSDDLKRLVVGRALAEPGRAILHAAERFLAFGTVPTRLYWHDPRGWTTDLYRGAVMALNLAVVAGTAVLAVALLRRRRWPWLVHGWWLGGAVIAVAATTAIGEKGEEARFVYAILPALLAAAGQALAGALALTRDSPPST